MGCTTGRTTPGLFGQQGAFTARLFFHHQENWRGRGGKRLRTQRAFHGGHMCVCTGLSWHPVP